MKNLSFSFVGICLLLCPLFYSGCDEDEDKLPPITMEGRNTFGCLVNGELWLPKGRFGQAGAHAELNISNDTVGIIIYADDNDRPSSIALSIYDKPTLKIEKSYDLSNSAYYGKYSEYVDDQAYFYEKVIIGNLQLIKFDIQNRIIAGTFEFKVYNSVCKDTITITEGRFDIGDIMQ